MNKKLFTKADVQTIDLVSAAACVWASEG
jgi:hypothetical protein